MDDAKKGLNTQIEYRCKMYKSMHEEAERKKRWFVPFSAPMRRTHMSKR